MKAHMSGVTHIEALRLDAAEHDRGTTVR
eukprot:COSAG06_NODE_29714_length_551_cov_1.181416_1_plen_28_part_10